MAEERTGLWFQRREGGLGFAPVSWQGWFATALLAVLSLFAIVLYSSLAATLLVIVVYLLVYGALVVVKSDLREEPPAEG